MRSETRKAPPEHRPESILEPLGWSEMPILRRKVATSSSRRPSRLIACSSGVVTLASTASALAPVYTAETVTVGGAMFGNCAIGSVGIATTPRSKMTSEQTVAKTGRRRKKSITTYWTLASS